jgi:exonuclease VII small subunit
MTDDQVYMNGYNNAIDELMEIVSTWVELASEEFYLDSKNNSWVSLMSLAKLSDELKW